MHETSHRFAGVLAADVAHFSRLMESDSEETVRALRDCRAAFQSSVVSHHGREFGSVGDSLMAEFSSPVEALRAAKAVQEALTNIDPVNEHGERLSVRIGIHAGDVIHDGDNLFGNVVNTAARLQGIARPGGIVLSDFVHRQVHKEKDFAFRSLGKQQLKNIAEPVAAYEVVEPARGLSFHRLTLLVQRYNPAIAATAGVIVAGLLFVTYLETREQPGIAGTVEVQPPSNSIAVLPFRKLGPENEDAYLAEGIHADILTQLSKLSALERVISRTSVERYRDSQHSLPEIGQALEVATILGGSVQQTSDRVRINVELIDAIAGDLIWAETYDRELTAENFFAMQSEIAHEVTAAMHINLSDEESEQLQAAPTASLEAYSEYVRGLAEESKRTPTALYRAEMHFRRAFEIDPEFAPAYVAAADVLYLQREYDPKNSDPAFEKRRELIDRALSIDPLLGEAYISLAWLTGQQGEIEEAEQLMRKGIDLSPHYHRAHHWYGVYLWFQGRSEESLAAFQKALDLAPDEAVIRLPMSRPLMQLGRSDEALKLLIEGVRQKPEIPNLYFAIGDWYEYYGALGEALRWARAGRAIAPENRLVASKLCHVQMKLQDYDAAERCIDWQESEFGGVEFEHRIDIAFGRSNLDEVRRLLRNFYSRTELSVDSRLGMLGYWTLLGDMETGVELLRSIKPDLFDEQGSIRTDLEFDIKRPATIEDVRNLEGLVAMGWSATALYVSGDAEDADRRYDEVLEILRAAIAVERQPYDLGSPFVLSEWLSPLLEMYVHGIRQDGPMVIKSIRDSLDYPNFAWFYEDAPLFEFLHNDPEWIELMDEIEGRIARERQYYEQHKDEPLF